MPDYSTGKIYKIVNHKYREFYVGSTRLTLQERLDNHKISAKSRGYMKIYKYLNTIGWDYVKIVLLEEYPCSSRKELENRETEWFWKLRPTLNSKVPCGGTILDMNKFNKNKYLCWRCMFSYINQECLNAHKVKVHPWKK
jgi:hypothetical protein